MDAPPAHNRDDISVERPGLQDSRRWRPGASQAWRTGRLALGVFLVVGLTLAVLLAPIDYRSVVGDYGYVGLFVLGIFTTGSLVLPIPYVAIILLAGSFLDPLLVAVVGAAGTAIGEITGYILGRTGRTLIPPTEWYQRIERAMARYGTLVTFLATLIPNPVAKAVVIIAGATRMAVWRLVLACFAGRALRFWAIAALGDALPFVNQAPLG